jgi:heat shock protein HtpX
MVSLFIAPLIPHLIIVAFAGFIFAAIVLKGSLHGRTALLLGIFGLMLIESFQMLLVDFGLEHLRHWHAIRSWSQLALTDLNIALVFAGAVGAMFVAAYAQFRTSRMDLTTAFPTMRFIEPTTELSKCVLKLSRKAGICTPEAMLVDSGTPAAFTLKARGKYIVAATVGLFECLDRREFEACIAHEVAHLKNNDFALRGFATLAKVALFARPISYFIEPAIYRSREYLADRTAAMLTNGPGVLASALSKLQEAASLDQITSMIGSAVCLNYSKPHAKGTLWALFNKHPDIESRIKLLLNDNALLDKSTR